MKAIVPYLLVLLHNLGILVLLTAICSALEFLCARRQASMRNIAYNVGCGTLALAVIYGVNLLVSPLLVRLHAHALLPADFVHWPLAAKWAVAVAALLIWDFFQYWVHRAQHRIGWLWHFHQLHHSDREVCGATSARKHLLSHFLDILCITLPMSVLFPDTPYPAWCAFLFFWCYGYFNHTVLQVELGPLTPILSGPRLHRVHHGIAPEYHDKNFAAFFPMIDILFGTYYRPARHEVIETGVHGCDSPNTLAGATIEPLVALRHMARAAQLQPPAQPVTAENNPILNEYRARQDSNLQPSDS